MRHARRQANLTWMVQGRKEEGTGPHRHDRAASQHPSGKAKEGWVGVGVGVCVCVCVGDRLASELPQPYLMLGGGGLMKA
jgi:hypothetical protein